VRRGTDGLCRHCIARWLRDGNNCSDQGNGFVIPAPIVFSFTIGQSTLLRPLLESLAVVSRVGEIEVIMSNMKNITKDFVDRARVLLRGSPRHQLLKLMPKNSICAEIGVWKGEFSKETIRIVRPRMLHLIDPWRYQPDKF
jgi:hypothetical protein